MPVVLTKTSPLTESSDRETPSLFDESGEPTLLGHIVADFLEHADFSECFEHPAAQPFIITVVAEDDESLYEDVMPGSVALKLVDEDDIADMFLHYVEKLAEHAATSESLEDRTRLAVLESALLKPLDEKYQRGAFRKLRKQPGGAELVNKMLGAMLAKGEIKRAKKSGKGYKGGDYDKGPRYKSGATKAVKTKGKLIRKRNAAKVKQSLQRTKRARNRARALAASVGMEESFLFGFGEPYSGALFEVSLRDVETVPFTEDELARLKRSYPDCYEGLTLASAKVQESEEPARTRSSITEAFSDGMPGAVGHADLTEGATIAAGAISALSVNR